MKMKNLKTGGDIMADTRLEMVFKNQLDKTTRLSIDSPRADVTEVEIRTAMDDIVARNLFNSTGGDLVSVVGARIITTDIQELTI